MMNYEICIDGHLEERWELWFDGLTIHRTYGNQGTPITCLVGPVIDRSALYGTLSHLRDMGVWLISVRQLNGTDSKGCKEL